MNVTRPPVVHSDETDDALDSSVSRPRTVTATRAVPLSSTSTPFPSLSCAWKTMSSAAEPPAKTSASSPYASIRTDLAGSIAPPLSWTVNSLAPPPITSPPPPDNVTETLAR